MAMDNVVLSLLVVLVMGGCIGVLFEQWRAARSR
jgi:hypothetical protein